MAQMRGENRFPIIIGLVIALGLPFAPLSTWGKTYSGLGSFWGGQAAWVIFFLVILLYVLFIERRPLSTIGFRRPKLWELLVGIAAPLAIIVGDAVISTIEARLHLAVKPQIAQLFALPFWFRVFVTFRAAVVEETAFRGYGFERLVDLTGSKWLAAAVTFVLFSVAHYSGGGLALALVAAWGGLVLTVLYLWRRNIWVTIITHWLTDAVGLLLIPAMGMHH
jgi:uncharacterized protein